MNPQWSGLWRMMELMNQDGQSQGEETDLREMMRTLHPHLSPKAQRTIDLWFKMIEMCELMDEIRSMDQIQPMPL